MSEPRYFGLTALGKRLFGFEKTVDGRRAHWMKLPLDFLGNPSVLRLPDSQRLALLAVGLLCVRRSNLVVMDATAVRKACHLRLPPDLDRFMAEGFIELDSTAQTSDSVRGEEIEEKRGEEIEAVASAPVAAAPKPIAVLAKPQRATWLTRPGELWCVRWGDESEPPWGEMGREFAKPRAAFEARGELDEFWSRWERFLAAAPTSQMARPVRFVQGLGEWGASARASPTRGKKSVGDVALDSAREAIELHRARGAK